MPIALSPKALRTARDSRRLSRQAVAVALGCSTSAIQSWERGWSEPAASVVPNLAALYGVEMESLFVHEPDANEASTVRVEVGGAR